MSERAELFETLSNFLDFKRNKTGFSVILFLFGIVALGWIASAVYGIFSLIIKLAVEWWRAEQLLDKRVSLLISSSLDLIVSTAVFYGIYKLMKYHLRPRPLEQTLAFETPAPHRGLIFLLSPYKPNTRGSQGSIFGVYDRIEIKDQNARAELLKSNWGPLVVAVQHHAQDRTLEHCWLICTKGEQGSARQFEKAEEVIKHFAGKKVECHKREIENLSDISEVAEVVRKIYEQAPLGEDLIADQIIADFTGGTAAMSGGLIIATLLEDRKVEYFSQDPNKPIFKKDGSVFTAKEIAEANVLITVVMSPKLLPAQPSE
jgi:hypothetical protein